MSGPLTGQATPPGLKTESAPSACSPSPPGRPSGPPSLILCPVSIPAVEGCELGNGVGAPPQAGADGEDHLRPALFAGRRALAWPASPTMFLLLPFDSLIVNLLGISLTVLFTLLLVFIIVPAVFGVSFGIRKLYMKTLLKIFAVSVLSTNGCFPEERSAVSQKKKKSCFCLVGCELSVGHGECC